MVSPLVNFVPKSNEKAFRFGIFQCRIRLVQGRPEPCFAMEINRIRMAWWGRLMQVLFCEPSLGKVGSDGLGVKNVLLYHNTVFSDSFALAPSGADKKQSFVRYITYAGRDLR